MTPGCRRCRCWVTATSCSRTSSRQRRCMRSSSRWDTRSTYRTCPLTCSLAYIVLLNPTLLSLPAAAFLCSHPCIKACARIGRVQNVLCAGAIQSELLPRGHTSSSAGRQPPVRTPNAHAAGRHQIRAGRARGLQGQPLPLPLCPSASISAPSPLLPSCPAVLPSRCPGS